MLKFPMNAHPICTPIIIYNVEWLFITLVILNLQLFSAARIVSLIYYLLLFLFGVSLDAANPRSSDTNYNVCSVPSSSTAKFSSPADNYLM